MEATMNTDTKNIVFELALSFINNTDKHVFLTGKAGTGKTTFLKQIREKTYKKSIIAAPTGVAAVHAEGVTIHTLFNLPLKPIVPTDKISLDSITFNTAKHLLLTELELLILDEASMIRADTLDAIDILLRRVRNQADLSFGGIQVLYIGDLLQLSPIAKPEDWKLLEKHYSSPFFIDSNVYKQTQPALLLLEKIYRQKDTNFITLLSDIRLGKNNDSLLRELNQLVVPSDSATGQDTTITLTTHNKTADEINQLKLNALPGDVHLIDALVTGNFLPNNYPTDRQLVLKLGAQVMLLRNNRGVQKKYFNGKVGIIEKIEGENLTIRFAEGDVLIVEKEIWKQIDYRYEPEQDDIYEEDHGSFQQFPVRLAWAITIHKSQGLTFEKAIVDAANSFLSGQVYVALSRLSTKEGLSLYSAIPAKAIKTDPHIVRFYESCLEVDEAEKILRKESVLYLGRTIIRCFDFLRVQTTMDLRLKQYSDDAYLTSLAASGQKLYAHSKTFSNELSILFHDQDQGYTQYAFWKERVEKATSYFSTMIEHISTSLAAELDRRKEFTLQKKFVQVLKQFLILLEQKRKEVMLAEKLAQVPVTGQNIQDLLFVERKQRKKKLPKTIENSPFASGQNGIPDYSVSLEMFQAGQTIAQIAEFQKLSTDTIEYQLAHFLKSGEVNIEQLISPTVLEKITMLLNAEPNLSLLELKVKVQSCSYGQLYAVQHYVKNRLNRRP